MPRDIGQVVFKRWSNRNWAVLASFHKIIIIGTLCYSYNMLGQEHSAGRTDSSTVRMHLELEEEEALADTPFELDYVSLKPLSTITSQDITSAPVTAHEDLLEYLPQVDIRHRAGEGSR